MAGMMNVDRWEERELISVLMAGDNGGPHRWFRRDLTASLKLFQISSNALLPRVGCGCEAVRTANRNSVDLHRPRTIGVLSTGYGDA